MLKDKVAIITGASRGIGREIALEFARNGASLALISLQDYDALEGVCKEIEGLKSGSVVSFSGDVSKYDFCGECVVKTIEKYQKIDILVNCAGIITRNPFEDLEPSDWNRVIDVNLTGPFYLSKLCIPEMKKNHYGKIINITSQMAFVPHPNASPSYEVSKAGLSALTRHLALLYAKFGITVNSLAPGSIDTDLPKSMSKEWRDMIKNAIPMGRLGEVGEVASAALFLATSMSSYITGTTLHVGGGSLMR